MRSRWSKYPTVKTVNLDSYITIDGTTLVCHPQAAGAERPYDKASGYGYWYPTQNQWGQWAFIYTPGQAGVLIRAVDPECGIQTWTLNRPGHSFTVHFFSDADDLIVEAMPPDPYAALLVYRAWASQQSWFPTDMGRINHLDSMALDAWNPTLTKNFLDVMAGGQRSVWSTGWRDQGFDVGYPQFKMKAGQAALNQEYEVDYDAPVFPYFNAALGDERVTGYPALNPGWCAVPKQGGTKFYATSRNGWVAPDPSSEAYHLMWYCLANSKLHDTIMSQFLSVRTTDGRLMRGLYFDVATAAIPGSGRYMLDFPSGGPCWAHGHDHEPGDPYAHMRGTKELLRRIHDTGALVMAESISEPYLNDVEMNLAFSATGVDNPGTYKPYWDFLYGHAKRDVFWMAPYSGEDDATTLASIQEAESWGRQMHGMPMNQNNFYSMMLDGNHPLTLAKLRAGLPDVLPSGDVFLLEDGSSRLILEDGSSFLLME